MLKMASKLCSVYICVCVLFIGLLAEGQYKERPHKFIGGFCDQSDQISILKVTMQVALESVHYEQKGSMDLLQPQDALHAGEATCVMINQNPDIAGIVLAPINEDSLRHVLAACDLLDLPLLITQPLTASVRSWSAINLFPHHSAFAEAVMELIKIKEWSSFTVIYEDDEGLNRLSGILAMHSNEEQYFISIRKLPEGDNYRKLLLVMKESEAEHFVVDCKIESARKFLEQAQQVGIISEPYAYIFTNHDLQTVDLDRYSHGGANITGFRIFDVTSPMIANFTNELNEMYEQLASVAGQQSDTPPEGRYFVASRLHSALPVIFDAVRLYGAALQDLIMLNSTTILDCEKSVGLEYGTTLINHMRMMKIDGLTGPIIFDEEGDRSDVTLEVFELIENGSLRTIGNWSKLDPARSNKELKLILERPPETAVEDDTDTMRNKTFRVVISLTPPYGMRRESTEKLNGNDRYEGFCVELIHELSKILGFNFIFEVQEDGVYGTYNETTGQWDGMLGKVIDGTVEFAITDLTITAEREAAVDFTTPFMNLGISILFRRPGEPSADPYSFLTPFSNGVWFSLGGAYIGCSFLLYILGRICPDEWQNPYPCVEEPETLENQFTLANALWFNLGAVLLQGSEIAPVAYGTRALASMWWFFALIITSSYTANLASQLASTQKVDLFHDVNELAHNQHNITYGAKKGGSTYSFFKGSNNELYKEMYNFMAAHPDLLFDSNDNGTKHVAEKSYAFLMESTSIEYLVERQCNLVQVGGLLDNKGYGLAMKKESMYRQKLNLALLNLQEQGKLASMKKKWWKEQRGGGVCTDIDEKNSEELKLENVGGVFEVLVVGCVIGLIISFLDMTLHVFRHSRQNQLPFLREFKRELKFVFNFNATEKPLRHERSASGTESNRALTLQSFSSSSDRGSGLMATSPTPELRESSPEQLTPKRRQSGNKTNSRRTSVRSGIGRRRSTMHENSIRLARQSTKE